MLFSAFLHLLAVFFIVSAEICECSTEATTDPMLDTNYTSNYSTTTMGYMSNTSSDQGRSSIGMNTTVKSTTVITNYTTTPITTAAMRNATNGTVGTTATTNSKQESTSDTSTERVTTKTSMQWSSGFTTKQSTTEGTTYEQGTEKDPFYITTEIDDLYRWKPDESCAIVVADVQIDPRCDMNVCTFDRDYDLNLCVEIPGDCKIEFDNGKRWLVTGDCSVHNALNGKVYYGRGFKTEYIPMGYVLQILQEHALYNGGLIADMTTNENLKITRRSKRSISNEKCDIDTLVLESKSVIESCSALTKAYYQAYEVYSERIKAYVSYIDSQISGNATEGIIPVNDKVFELLHTLSYELNRLGTGSNSSNFLTDQIDARSAGIGASVPAAVGAVAVLGRYFATKSAGIATAAVTAIPS